MLPPRLAAESEHLVPDCHTSRLHLHEFVDGELMASASAMAVRQLIARHLSNCARCARLDGQLRAQRALLRLHAERTAEHASAALRERVRELLAG
jgi:hypothetical protein